MTQKKINNTDIEEFYKVILEILSEKYQYNTSINYSDELFFLPYINKNVINWPKRIRFLFFLQELSNLDPSKKSTTHFIEYYLAIKLTSYNYYSKAELLLEKLLKDLNGLENKKVQTCFPLNVEEYLSFQCLFLFLHEFFHGLFGNQRSFCISAINQMKEMLEEIFNNRTIIRKLFTRLLSLMGTNFGTLINDKRKIEEFACDLYAWRTLVQIFVNGGFSDNELLIMCTSCIFTLHNLENIKLLDDVVTTSDYQFDPKANRSFLFSSRIHVLEHNIRIYLAGEKRYPLDSFEKQLKKVEHRKFLNTIPRIIKNFSEGINLLRGASNFDALEKNRLIQKIEEIENKIFSFFEKSNRVAGGF